MIIVIIGLSILFAAIGYIITDKNAKNLLAGYNTMSEKEQEQFDLKSYIPAFRNFHLFLGISLLVTGISISLLIGEISAGIFIAVYPLSAYAVFLMKGKKYYSGKSIPGQRLGILLLLLIIILVTILFSISLKENKLTVDTNRITIHGMYGEKINFTEVASIVLTDTLPGITFRSNGFSLGNIRKGYFKTQNAEKVKLLLHSDKQPFLFITKKSGEKIFYSAKHKPADSVYKEINEIMHLKLL